MMKYWIKSIDKNEIINDVEIEGDYDEVYENISNMEYVKLIGIPEKYFFDKFELIESWIT